MLFKQNTINLHLLLEFAKICRLGLKVKNEKRLRKSGSLYAQDKAKIRQNDEDGFGLKNIQKQTRRHAVQEPQDGCLLTPETGIHKKWLKIVTFSATFH